MNSKKIGPITVLEKICNGSFGSKNQGPRRSRDRQSAIKLRLMRDCRTYVLEKRSSATGSGNDLDRAIADYGKALELDHKFGKGESRLRIELERGVMS
jgi:hypothetical protein